MEAVIRLGPGSPVKRIGRRVVGAVWSEDHKLALEGMHAGLVASNL